MKWVKQEEIVNLECIRSVWIARDKDGGIFLYGQKPERLGDQFRAPFDSSYCCVGLSDDFPSLKWEDEPRECYIEITVLSVREKEIKRLRNNVGK